MFQICVMQFFRNVEQYCRKFRIIKNSGESKVGYDKPLVLKEGEDGLYFCFRDEEVVDGSDMGLKQIYYMSQVMKNCVGHIMRSTISI